MTKDNWRSTAESELRGRPVEDLTWKTLEGIDVQPVYDASDISGLDHLGSMPGEAPFTRGVKATMYAGRPWTLRQYAGFSTAEESNAFSRRNLAADDVVLSAQVSDDLVTWKSGSGFTVLVREIPGNDGTSTMTWRSARPIAADEVEFLRIRATSRP